MAYFNHAFNRVFLGTKNASLSAVPNPNQSAGTVGFASGFIINGTYSTANLIDGSSTGSNLGIGSFGFFDPNSWTSVNAANLVSAGKVCCPLVLASTALYQRDQIGGLFTGAGNIGCPTGSSFGNQGGFHGGYQESNKSKVINPKYLSRFYRVDPCVPNQNVVHVGATPYTLAQGLDCCKEFLCDQAYTLRIDIKGSPALRALTHNAYFETSTWTGCCPPNALAPTAVDPTTVYIYWATQLLNSPLISPFIQIIVYDQAGLPVGNANDVAAWCAYTPQAVVPCVPGQPTGGAGMTFIGAYVGTIFGDCTFYPTDFFEKEPVQIYASMVDLTGDVCEFTGICVTESCCPRQGNGFGDTVLKDLILSERYQQNDFYTGRDLRIREITQGYDVTNAVNRASFFTRYYIQHNVPRFNNPTGVFDNDQYLLEIITNGIDANLEAFMAAWTAGCAPCPAIEIYSCGPICCVPLVLTFEGGTVVNFALPVAGTAPFVATNPGVIGTTGLTLNANATITGTANPAGGTGSVSTTVTDSYGVVVGCFDIQIVVLA